MQIRIIVNEFTYNVKTAIYMTKKGARPVSTNWNAAAVQWYIPNVSAEI
jgi:hypothetical protein